MSDLMTAQHDILQQRRGTTADCLEFYDRLDPVDLPFMIGRWQGFEIATGHPQDGILEATRWYGKEFEDPETVHPLLHRDGRGRRFRVRPHPTLVSLSLRLPVLKSRLLWPVSRLLTRLLKTNQSQARLRMTEHRGKVSATMIYDGLPINDHFRRIDENTVLGLMDFKGLEPYFFGLQREPAAE